MKKRVITVCDECEKNVLKKENLIQVTSYGYKSYMLGGVYTFITRDFCSTECACKNLKTDWNNKEEK